MFVTNNACFCTFQGFFYDFFHIFLEFMSEFRSFRAKFNLLVICWGHLCPYQNNYIAADICVGTKIQFCAIFVHFSYEKILKCRFCVKVGVFSAYFLRIARQNAYLLAYEYYFNKNPFVILSKSSANLFFAHFLYEKISKCDFCVKISGFCIRFFAYQ